MIGGMKLNVRSLTRVRDTVERALDQVERRGMKDALLKAATPMVRAARGLAPRDTGALRKSIGKRGRTYRDSRTAYVAIGPRSSFEQGGRRPAKYAHLVEFGHGVDGGGFVPPRPFMRPAFHGAEGESRGIYAREVGDAILRHFRRAKRSGRL